MKLNHHRCMHCLIEIWINVRPCSICMRSFLCSNCQTEFNFKKYTPVHALDYHSSVDIV